MTNTNLAAVTMRPWFRWTWLISVLVMDQRRH